MKSVQNIADVRYEIKYCYKCHGEMETYDNPIQVSEGKCVVLHGRYCKSCGKFYANHLNSLTHFFGEPEFQQYKLEFSAFDDFLTSIIWDYVVKGHYMYYYVYIL